MYLDSWPFLFFQLTLYFQSHLSDSVALPVSDNHDFNGPPKTSGMNCAIIHHHVPDM